MCDDAQPWAGTESFYLWSEDLAEGHGDLSAMAAQTRAVPEAAAAGRDSMSATTLEVPGT